MQTIELIQKVAAATGVSHDVVKAVVDESFDQIKKSLVGGEPYFKRGFGTFGVKMRKGCVNNLTGKGERMPDKRKPYFRPSKEFVKDCNA